MPCSATTKAYTFAALHSSTGRARTYGIIPEYLARLAGGGCVDKPRRLALRQWRVRDTRDARCLRHIAARQQHAAQQGIQQRGFAYAPAQGLLGFRVADKQ